MEVRGTVVVKYPINLPEFSWNLMIDWNLSNLFAPLSLNSKKMNQLVGENPTKTVARLNFVIYVVRNPMKYRKFREISICSL